MYYYIKGNLAYKGENFAVIEAAGVGYKIYTSSFALQSLAASGSETTMYTHLYVREDIQDLYGFPTIEEKNMFMTLLSVSGVGPKAALAILSAASPSALATAVVTNNAKVITKAQGVGPKLAQRIILELKDKLKSDDIQEMVYSDTDVISSDNLSEAVSALMVLGYSQNDAKKAVSGADASMNVEDIIKTALTKLF